MDQIYNQMAKSGVREIKMDLDGLEGALSLCEVINTDTGEILLEPNLEVTSQTINNLTAFNDSGQVALMATLNSLSGSPNALLRCASDGTYELVAYQTLQAPGAPPGKGSITFSSVLRKLSNS
jgi:hypothetical protein